MSWQADKRWSDRFIPEIKLHLAPHVIGEASVTEDATHNTDLIVLEARTIRIACRVRRPGYEQRYPDEFTIRTTRPNGSKTELRKIVAGWGDLFFYGHAGADSAALASWFVGDLNIFREWFTDEVCREHGQVPGTVKHNRDGSSTFRAFDLKQLPAKFVLSRSQDNALW